MKFKQTKIDWARMGVAARLFFSSLKIDITNDFLRPLLETIPAFRSWKRRSQGVSNEIRASARPESPLIFVSYCAGSKLKGSHKFCGGEKLLNNLVLLLRRHGYAAFMVSLDGEHSHWLLEHAPYISLEKFIQEKNNAADVRCVTSWIQADAYLEHCPKFYFWDQELGASARSHFPKLADQMAANRIVRTAGVNRVVQTWHTAVFARETSLLRQLVDEHHWRPDPARRLRHRVGYFDEGSHTGGYIQVIQNMCLSAGLKLEFFQLCGVEKEIISQMQTCAVFLTLNIGKSVWGEGGPMTPQEAMACGTVPICFDLKGAWELIQQGYNGIITDEIRPELMGRALIEIYESPGRLELMSRRCVEITASSHTMEARWPTVRRFLDLPEEEESLQKA